MKGKLGTVANNTTVSSAFISPSWERVPHQIKWGTGKAWKNMTIELEQFKNYLKNLEKQSCPLLDLGNHYFVVVLNLLGILDIEFLVNLQEQWLVKYKQKSVLIF